MPTVSPSQLRESFFEFLFDEQDGYVCLALADVGEPAKMRNTFRQTFFHWPDQKGDINRFVEEVMTHKHIWFGVNLFSRPQRRTEYAIAGRLVYADLDACNPEIVTPTPSIAIQTSPGRYHALWRVDQRLDPDIAADYSRRIAYKYSVSGADRSGWDITQLLRVPYTRNFKYEGYPEVKVVSTGKDYYTPVEFEQIEVPKEYKQENGDAGEMPEFANLPDAKYVLYRYFGNDDKFAWAFAAFESEPDEGDDWSGIMWRLINTLVEEGASAEETYAVALNAKCNKYVRDNRPMNYLWKEVQKALLRQKNIQQTFEEYALLKMPDIGLEPASETIVNKYVDWATQATDAVPIFHELGAFIILSSLLSSNIRLETDYGSIVPNLWGMLLGESTLTRKTTAMRLATDVIAHVDSSVLTATDATVEGLLSELRVRPSMASLFFRDEITGLFDAINRKDYMASFREVVTNLYDVPAVFRRALSKETVYVENPILIFFGGGVRDKVYGLLNEEYILSGFLPRFLIVSGNTDLERLRFTRRASEENVNDRLAIYKSLDEIHSFYNSPVPTRMAGQTIMVNPTIKADLTDEAWDHYANIERTMTVVAEASHIRDLALPTLDRMSRSLLKMSILLAATRQEPNENKIEVNLDDVKNSAYYIQRWGQGSIDMMYNAGKTSDARIMEKVNGMIQRKPGIFRSELMRNFHFTKRQMDVVLETLVDRGEVRSARSGKGTKLWPVS